jgi:glycosyltransferase involved in cell wall biosynthesis
LRRSSLADRWMPIASSPISRVAFYAPMKPPDHPIASGDREIARLIVAALERKGCTVEIASRLISYQKRPSTAVFEEKRRLGEEAARQLVAAMQARPASRTPQLWLTYHPYCKSPDWLGPVVSGALGISYATVEACRTRQDTDADWQLGRDAVQAAIRRASVNFCMKPSDLSYLREVLGGDRGIVPLAPFMDVESATCPSLGPDQPGFANSHPIILAVGMMRPGKKAECYRLLAQALRKMPNANWNLVVIGDGPERESIIRDFAFVDPERIRFTGAISREAVLGSMQACDIFAWPGYREPIGMVYLEAQANGLPVVALRSLGVPAVVVDGTTGILTEEGDDAAYAEAIRKLLEDPDRRRRLGEAGRRHVRTNHGIEAASVTFRRALDSLPATQ